VVAELPRVDGRRWVHVRCSCGNEKQVRLASLRAGLTRSCGHLRPTPPIPQQRRPITGERFGKLVVAGEVSGEHGSLAHVNCDCGRTKIVRRGSLVIGATQSCGECQREDIETRFWTKVDYSGGPGTCWPWKAAKDEQGYGAFWLDAERRTVRAIRVAYALAYTVELLPTQVAGHSCNNPSCCNPAHLYATSNEGNIADRTVQSRSAVGDRHGARLHPESRPRGEKHHNAKFTVQQVQQIRALAKQGTSQRKIAAQFGCSRTAIEQIISKKTWTGVPD
jgi:hypothetical protein